MAKLDCVGSGREECLDRLARLEERVFVGQAEKLDVHTAELSALSKDIKALTNRLNYLIAILAANFGVAFFKTIPAVEKLLM
jgi:hypothetical protein